VALQVFVFSAKVFGRTHKYEAHSNAAASLRSMRSAWWLQLWLACFAARLLAEQTGERRLVPPAFSASQCTHCALPSASREHQCPASQTQFGSNH
jgi:hypothetical protein